MQLSALADFDASESQSNFPLKLPVHFFGGVIFEGNNKFGGNCLHNRAYRK